MSWVKSRMNRRDFLKSSAIGALSFFGVGGFPLAKEQHNSGLQRSQYILDWNHRPFHYNCFLEAIVMVPQMKRRQPAEFVLYASADVEKAYRTELAQRCTMGSDVWLPEPTTLKSYGFPVVVMDRMIENHLAPYVPFGHRQGGIVLFTKSAHSWHGIEREHSSIVLNINCS